MTSSLVSGPFEGDLEAVRTAGKELDLPIWLVGGPVRDALLGRPVTDLDFLVEERVEELAATVARALNGTVRTHPSFMSAKVLHGSGRTIDLTTARAEIYPRPGALPVVRPATLEEDLLRRDFSVNAIAWHLHDSSFADPTGGRRDLESRRIRILHDASFIDDPTRMFRAVRFASRLGFEIENETHRRLQQAVEGSALGTISPERIWREVVLAMSEPDPAATLRALLREGILQSWLRSSVIDPDLGSRLGTLAELMEWWPDLDREALYLATLLGGTNGVPVPDGTGLSRRRLALVDRLVATSGHRASQWNTLGTDADRGRFCLEMSPEECISLALRLTRPRELVEVCRRLHEQSLPFTGEALGLPPGPHIGKALRDARIKAWIEGGPDETLLEFARQSALRYLNEGKS